MSRVYKAEPKIVTIGGGTGLSVLLRGLKKQPYHLTAVVTVADDGGHSGVLREDLGMLPPGDIRSCLLALADEESVMQELLRYRFTGGRLSGQNVGNLILAALNDIYGNFEEAVCRASDILRVQGNVIPVSGTRITLCAELENGNIVSGESRIPEVVLRDDAPVRHVFLDPADTQACASALEAIRQADLILIGPGSLYTSILPNLLVGGICEAIRNSGGCLIYVCNVMTQPGETDGYTVRDHVETLRQYLQGMKPEYVIANDRLAEGAHLRPYEKDGARQIIPDRADREYCREQQIHLIQNDLIEVKKGYIRHDADRIGAMLSGIMNA